LTDKKRPPGRPTPDAVVDAARAIVRLSRRLEVALAEADLTLSQYRVLTFLANGESRPSRIAPNVSVTRPTVTALLDGLVVRGLVDRQPDETDRRRVRHRVTAAGKRALAEADRAAEANLRALGAHLDPACAAEAIEGLAVWHAAIDAAIAEGESTSHVPAAAPAAGTRREATR
jgi:long-chain acyl-CoA synthetase